MEVVRESVSQAESKEEMIAVGTDTIHLGADSRVIYHPHYSDASRQKIKAIVRMPDGGLSEMEADCRNKSAALIRDVYSQYSEGEIEMFTHRENCIAQKMNELKQRLAEDRKRNQEREETFQAKAKALALPQIRDHEDKEVRRQIRRAASAFEVMVLTVKALS